jgi:hypothetical protein
MHQRASRAALAAQAGSRNAALTSRPPVDQGWPGWPDKGTSGRGAEIGIAHVADGFTMERCRVNVRQHHAVFRAP